MSTVKIDNKLKLCDACVFGGGCGVLGRWCLFGGKKFYSSGSGLKRFINS